MTAIGRMAQREEALMKSQTLTVQCQEGLHLRVASQMAQIAQKSGGTVEIRNRKGRPNVNVCSIIELLTLGATPGTALEIVADGPNEDTVLGKLSEVLNQTQTA